MGMDEGMAAAHRARSTPSSPTTDRQLPTLASKWSAQDQIAACVTHGEDQELVAL